jgi:sarcosine oxidase subunit alpha
VRFRFDGASYAGYSGDTLASALLAQGVRLVGRSFKYHRPRGIFGAGSEEPNALVELRTGPRREPNTRATVAELYDGLEARSQNRWPSLGFDVGSVNSLLSPLFVAGFYYKTFMWPRSFWEKFYEPAIRQAAGLGHASRMEDPDRYEQAHAHCDLLVIGGGPAGLSAALAAGRAGARVILCDEDFLLGGRLNADAREIDDVDGGTWAREAVDELASMPRVRILRRTTVFGVYDGCTYGAVERVCDHLAEPPAGLPRQRYWKIFARHSVLAAGAIERSIAFGGNDRPGVMLGSAVRTYIERFGIMPGRRAVVFTASDDGWTTAKALARAGVEVAAMIDARDKAAGMAFAEAESTFRAGAVVATKGAKSLRQVTVRTASGQLARIDADLLCISGGWNPALALSTHLGSRPAWSDAISAFVPDAMPPGMVAAGAVAGAFSLSSALREGALAGHTAATEAGYSAPAPDTVGTDDESVEVSAIWHVRGSRGKAFVDLQHDVTTADIGLAAREGYRSVEHLKRYTTLGMATDQGKTSGIVGHAILAETLSRPIPEVGTTAPRPPYTPVTLGALAGIHRGRHVEPTRRTATHALAERCSAQFMEAGQWLRAQWYGDSATFDWVDIVSREVAAVRSSVGVCDVSTLGKIDIQGPDAGAFLDRVYTNTFSTLAVGKTRYGLMLREDGFVFDDGTTARLGPDHYVMSTTTANAGRVMQHLEHARQVIWPDLDVNLLSVTEQWSQFAVAGPNARELLTNLLGNSIDLSDAAFPFLACAEFIWAGMPVRIFRISFSGELAYELAVPASAGEATMEAIMDAGADIGVKLYGTEAMTVMRVEKGHVASGELNGMTTASDLGLGRLMSTKKDFIGAVLARRAALQDSDRPGLVGLRPLNPAKRINAGAHFLEIGASADLASDLGYMTTATYSEALASWIGLGFVRGGRARVGERVRAYDPVRGSDVEVEVCNPVFYDPEGQRLHG